LGVGSSIGRHAVDSIFSSASGKATLSQPTYATPPKLPEPNDKNIERMTKMYNECIEKATTFEETEKCEKFSVQTSSAR
jgi:hypothetical protein